MENHGLDINKVTLTRQQRPLVADFSYSLVPGEALVLMGPNGCGKSSLLKGLAGLLPLDSEQVHLAGVSNRELAFRWQIHYQGHQPALKGALTVRENLQLDLSLVETTSEQVLQALQSWQLWPQRDMLAKDLSAGQLRRLGLARLALVQAKLWLLDEPLTALDSQAVASFGRLLQVHLEQGGMAVVTTHQPLEVDGCQIHTMDLASC